jgi:hypothetical protein
VRQHVGHQPLLARIFSISAGDLQMITGRAPLADFSAASTAAATTSGGWSPSIRRNVARAE